MLIIFIALNNQYYLSCLKKELMVMMCLSQEALNTPSGMHKVINRTASHSIVTVLVHKSRFVTCFSHIGLFNVLADLRQLFE